MYHARLTNRYLTSRIIPLIAVAAVALCVALVIIVVSVMSGFLDMLRNSGRTLMGDVVVSYPVRGIPHYDRLLEMIRELPEAHAASPMIDTFGLLRMPYPDGDDKEIATVQVWAVDPESFAAVTDLESVIWWKPPTPAAAALMGDDDPRRTLATEQTLLDGLSLRDGRTGRPAIVMGIHVSIANRRQSDGSYRVTGGGRWWMPAHEVSLTLAPISARGRLGDAREVIFPVANEFQSGVFQVDRQRVLIPLSEGQSLLRMSEAELVDPRGALDEDGRPRVIGIDPAKVTKILVRARPGITPQALRAAVREAYERFEQEILLDASLLVLPPASELVSVMTWEETLRDLIGPVEKEREMMRILFSIIYLVCAGLVLSIFWAIVHEKTRDIGILRSVGAARSGIVWIFLRYGLVIGCIGAVIGLGLAWIVVRNINAIHDAIGRDAPREAVIACFVLAAIAAGAAVVQIARQRLMATLLCTLGAITLALAAVGLTLHRGTAIWDPSVYYFTRIPSEVDIFTAVLTMCGAVLFSLLGASIPAAKAADTDPVRALRYE